MRFRNWLCLPIFQDSETCRRWARLRCTQDVQAPPPLPKMAARWVLSHACGSRRGLPSLGGSFYSDQYRPGSMPIFRRAATDIREELA